MKSRNIKNINTLQQERLLFTNLFADESEVAAYYNHIPMTKEILESSINKIITNCFYNLFLDYLEIYKELINELVAEMEDHVKDTQIPQVVMDGLDSWFHQFKDVIGN